MKKDINLMKLLAKTQRKALTIAGNNVSKYKRSKEFMDDLYNDVCKNCRNGITRNAVRMSPTWLKEHLCDECKPHYYKRFDEYVKNRKADER